jgi:hypothetical protein
MATNNGGHRRKSEGKKGKDTEDERPDRKGREIVARRIKLCWQRCRRGFHYHSVITDGPPVFAPKLARYYKSLSGGSSRDLRTRGRACG